MRNVLALASALTLGSSALAAELLDAQLRCPPGTTAVSTGSFHSQSCVGSSYPGLVSSTLPYQRSNLLGSPTDFARDADPVFTVPERPPVGDQPSLPAAIGHIAASSTALSAAPSADPAIPAKLWADWSFMFDGPRVPNRARVAWMGGFLSRSELGALFFETSYGTDFFLGSIEPFRRNPGAFLAAVGPSTRRLFSERYGSNSSTDPRALSANSAAWDQAILSNRTPGSTVMVGGAYGSNYVTVFYGAQGSASFVSTSNGKIMSLSDFASTPEFGSITGRGVAFGPH